MCRKYSYALALSALVLLPCIVRSQPTPSARTYSINEYASKPVWIEMIDDTLANYFEVEKAYTTYWEHHTLPHDDDFERHGAAASASETPTNDIEMAMAVRMYKAWLADVQPYVQSDGRILTPRERIALWQKSQRNTALLNQATADTAGTAVGHFSFLGPDDQPMRTTLFSANGVGRVSHVLFHPTNPNKMYAVSNRGGIWISTDRGRTWSATPGTDKMPTTATSCVCVDNTNDSILYLGCGDANAYNGSFGIWKSTDAGASFIQISNGLGNGMISEILMSPTDHNTLLATTCVGRAPSGHGIFKTTNGGESWTLVHPGSKRFDDMKMRPGSKSVVYVASGDTLFRSTDFGNSWTGTALRAVPPTNLSARIGTTPADPNVVYIGCSAGPGYLLKSTDGGSSFTSMYSGTSGCLVCYDSAITSGSQGDYNFAIGVSPTNPNEVLLVAQNVWRTTNSGVTWTEESACYTARNLMWDMHQVLFDPRHPQEVFLACDGGIWSSMDTERTLWRARNVGLGAMESYRAAQHPLQRDVLTTANQDDGEQTYTGRWLYQGGGDMDGAHYFDYRPDWNIWIPYTNEHWKIYDSLESVTRSLYLPFQANYPTNVCMAFCPSFPNLALLGRDTLWRCSNISQTDILVWKNIFPSTQPIKDIQFSRADSSVLFVVTSRDTIFRCDNFTSSTPRFVAMKAPGSTDYSGHIATSRQNKNLLYMGCQNKIYMSTNNGASWSNISYNLPTTDVVNILHDDYSKRERLFVGTGSSVYYKEGSDTIWSLIPGLPTLPILKELMLYNDGTSASILRAATFGRGVWECPINNDLTPIPSFSVDKPNVCSGEEVNFTLKCYGTPSTINWSFPGGSPSTSTLATPTVVYPATGTYDVTVIVQNAGGADTLLKRAFIHVKDSATSTVLSENFEKNGIPSTWVIPNPIHIYGWRVTSVAGGFQRSAHSIVFNNYDHDQQGGRNAILTAPVDLTHKTNAKLKFDVAYQYTFGYPDSLLVQASTDCGSTWYTIYSKGALNLATTVQEPVPDTGALAFVPDAASVWRSDTVKLTDYVGKTVLLSFVNVGHGGSTLYLDNIQVSGTTAAVAEDLMSSPQLQVYPNPSTGIVHVHLMNLAGPTGQISCYTSDGSQISSEIESLTNGTLDRSLDFTQRPAGVYELRISGKQQLSQKIVVIH